MNIFIAGLLIESIEFLQLTFRRCQLYKLPFYITNLRFIYTILILYTRLFQSKIITSRLTVCYKNYFFACHSNIMHQQDFSQSENSFWIYRFFKLYNRPIYTSCQGHMFHVQILYCILLSASKWAFKQHYFNNKRILYNKY